MECMFLGFLKIDVMVIRISIQVQPGIPKTLDHSDCAHGISVLNVSSQADGVHMLQVNLAVPDELCASVVPRYLATGRAHMLPVC